MNIVFFTLVRISNNEDRGIYSDLMRKFRDDGHKMPRGQVSGNLLVKGL